MLTRTALVLILTTAPVHAAPVPPAAPLTESSLCGTWTLSWDIYYRGPCTFWSDGSYRYDTNDGVGTVYQGRWWLDRGRLVLCERSVSNGVVSDVMRYEIRLAGELPVLRGKVVGTETLIRLSR